MEQQQQDSIPQKSPSTASHPSAPVAAVSNKKPHSESERYKHDILQAQQMRRRTSATTNSGKAPTASNPSTTPPAAVKDNAEAVALGLRGLDEAEVLRQNGRLQAALDLYQSAIEVLIQMLQGDKLRNSGYDKEVLSGRVSMALSDAEQLKERLRTQQTSGEASADTRSPLKKTCFDRITSYLASVRNGTTNINTAHNTSARPSTTHPINAGSHRSLTTVHQQPAGSQRRLGQPNARNVNSTSSRSIQSKHTGSNHPAATSPTSQPSVSSSSSAVSASQRLANNESNMLKATVLDDMYVPPAQLQSITWNDIAGLADCKQALQEAAIMPMLRPDLFTGLRKPQNILLYGPPGTGKTMLVKAVACESQCSLFLCTASAMTSKWHGDSEKLVRALFSVAQHAAPSIVFIDEIDAMLSTRKSEGEHEASRRFKTEFMVQMDGISSSASNGANNVLLIACTNCPWDVDSAVLRRFSRRIFVPLPDREARKALIKGLLKKAGKHSLSKSQISDIVKRMRGFSGSDMQSIASEASFGPLRSVGNLDAIRKVKATDVRPISIDDFEAAIDKATKSVTKDQLKQYEEWNAQQSASS